MPTMIKPEWFDANYEEGPLRPHKFWWVDGSTDGALEVRKYTAPEDFDGYWVMPNDMATKPIAGPFESLDDAKAAAIFIGVEYAD